jgi:hypothetical protein
MSIEGKSILIHTTDSKSFAYQLFSIDGRLVDFGKTGAGQKHRIDMKAEPGLYVLRLNDGEYTCSFTLPE